MDQSHVAFRWKDRYANAWRTERLAQALSSSGASCSTSGPKAFTRSDVGISHFKKGLANNEVEAAGIAPAARSTQTHAAANPASRGGFW
jgi:hypothetical protein